MPRQTRWQLELLSPNPTMHRGKQQKFIGFVKKRAEIFLIYRINDRLDTATFSSRLCGYHSPSEPLTFLSSGNVMLVTMATNDKKNYPGFRAQVSQVKRGGPGKTGFFSEWWTKLTNPTIVQRTCLIIHSITDVLLFIQRPYVEASCRGKMASSLRPTSQIITLPE